MNVGQLLSAFRTETFDLVEPYLWGDEEVIGYIDEAQEMFCRLTDGLADTQTLAVTRLSVAAGAEWAALHPRIKKIRAATFEADGRALEVVNLEDLATRGWRHTTVPGPLRALVIGEQENQARLYPRPAAATVVRLSVFRLPLQPLAAPDDELEVAQQHHRALLHWAKHRAYSKHDTETLDKEAARAAADAFYAYCDQARREQGLSRHKSRTVTYGGY